MRPGVRLAAFSVLLFLSLALLVANVVHAAEPVPVSGAVTTDCTSAGEPEIAAGAHGFLVAFGGWAARLDSLGNRLDERRVLLNGNSERVVWFHERYVTLDGLGRGSSVTEAGEVTAFKLPFDMNRLFAMAASDDRLVIIYNRYPSVLRLAVLDTSLNVKADTLIDPGTQWPEAYSVSAVATNDGFLVAYSRIVSWTDPAYGWTYTYRTWTANVHGDEVSARTFLTDGLTDPLLAWDGERALIVWNGTDFGGEGLRSQFLDSIGTPASPLLITPGYYWRPKMTWTGSEFVIAYVTDLNSRGDVALLRIDSRSGSAGPPIPVIEHDGIEQSYCAIAAGGDSIIIAWMSWWGWSGVKSVAWDRRFVPRQSPQVLSRAYASQYNPVVASLDGTNLVVWWEGRCEGLIVAARIRDDGEAMDGSGVVLSDAAASDARVIPAGDRFVVYWTERRPDQTLFTVLQPVTKDLELLPRIVLPYWAFQIVSSTAHDELLTISPALLHENDRYSSLAVKRLLENGSIIDGAIVSVAGRNPAALDLVANDDGYLLVFDDVRGGCQFTCPPEYYEYVSRVYAQRLDAEGNAMSPLVTLADHASGPRARWTGTDYLVTLASPSVWRVFIRRDGSISSEPSAGAVPYVENVTDPYAPTIVETLTDGVTTMIARGTSDRELSGSGRIDPNARLLTLPNGGLRLVYLGDRPPTTGSTRVYSCRVSDVVNDISVAFVNVPSRIDTSGVIDVPIVLTNNGRATATSVSLYFTSYGPAYLPDTAQEDLPPGESRTIIAHAYAGGGVTSLFANLTAAERDVFPADNSASWNIILPICGDANGDGFANGTDVVFLVNYLFAGGPAPVRGDANGDGVTTMSDVFYLVNYVFATGSAPACP